MKVMVIVKGTKDCEAGSAPSFKRYTQEFNPQTGMGGTEIWIPIKARLFADP
jgi:predicted transcriptional regulator YdeE